MKFSLCNEVFEGWTWADTVQVTAEAGYDGIEIAPFTLVESVADLSPAERRALRQRAEGAGLEVVGLHWLFLTPKGLHTTTDDASTRQRTTEYLKALIDFCGDLGGQVMVIGSPQQRNVQQGVAYEVAWQRFVDMVVACLDLAAARGVTLCMEALPADQCNFVTSLAEAARMVRQVDHPNFQTMFDVHNARLEADPLPDLVRRYLPLIRHVHVNEMDGSYPGSGDFDFGSILRVLQEGDYRGYVSAEVFDYTPGAAYIARETIRHLREAIRDG
jgi:D-psicose/D-tagatose/L-ribulose 3-epimerase